MKAITFWTNEADGRSAQALARQLDNYGIACDVDWIPDQGTYQKTRHHVPVWILWKLSESIGSVLWLNATAKVLADPVLLKDPDCDFAAFKMGDAYWAKTLYVRNSEKAKDTLRRWASLNAAHPTRISCENLTEAIKAVQPKVIALPPSYSWLDESFPEVYPAQRPVILHTIGGL